MKGKNVASNKIVKTMIAAAGLGLLLSLGAAAQSPAHNGVLVRINAADLNAFNSRHQTAAWRLNPNQDVYWVKAGDNRSDSQLLAEVSADSVVLAAEDNSDAQDGCDQSTISVLNEADSDTDDQSTISVLNQSTISVLNSGSTDYYGANVLNGYLHQPAIAQINAVNAAHYATGAKIIVALIDDGVDPQNPVLKSVLLSGYNFYANTGDWSCYADLSAADADSDDQSTISVLNDADIDTDADDQSTISVLNDVSITDFTDSQDDQSTISVLNDAQSDDGDSDDQSTISVLNSSVTSGDNELYQLLKLYPEIGHGTAVAGLIHLIAPQASILPIKAFGPDGTATLASIIASIYYAVDHHADVINMSFSATASSNELRNAVNYANSHNVVLVAAAGNGANSQSLFPAAYKPVLSVASVDSNNTLSSFSSYGSTVNFAAPGDGVISTYPDGQWAAVAGTSFSAPLVAGEAALLLQEIHEGRRGDSIADALMAWTANSNIPADNHQQTGNGLIQVDPALRLGGGGN